MVVADVNDQVRRAPEFAAAIGYLPLQARQTYRRQQGCAVRQLQSTALRDLPCMELR